MDLYAEQILEHYRNPQHTGLLQKPSVTHEEVNLSCGDSVTLSLHIKDGVIQGIGWVGTGCAISQAAMSMLSETLAGMQTEKAAQLTPADIHALLGVPVGPRRTKCALLGLHTLKNALHSLAGTPSQDWSETVTG